MIIVNGNQPGSSASSGAFTSLSSVVFAGQTVQAFANGATPTIGGLHFTAVKGNAAGTIEIVSAGLKLSLASASNVENALVLDAGQLKTIIGADRFARGRWGYRFRVASLDFTSTSNCYSGIAASGGYPYQGVSARCSRLSGGAPNTATGGFSLTGWWNGTEATNVSPSSNVSLSSPVPAMSGVGAAITANDSVMVVARSPYVFEVWIGTWTAGDYPAQAVMWQAGIVDLLNQSTGAANASSIRDIALWILDLRLGGSGSGYVTIERFDVFAID